LRKIKEELCEGCGKVVKETVLKVKENIEGKFKKNELKK